jgi:hypothetical protein
MAVTSVTAIECDYSEPEDGDRVYVATFEVITNARTDGPGVVAAAGLLPRRGDLLIFNGTIDTSASCRSRSIKLRSVENTAKVWRVTCNYSCKGSTSDPADSEAASPLDYAWKFSGSYLSFMKSPEKDINDRAIQNVCGEDFLPPPEFDDPQLELIAEKNTPTLSLSTWAAYKGSVNAAAIWGLAARELKLRQWTWKPMWTSSGQAYIANRFDLGVKLGGWNAKPLNQGFRRRVVGALGAFEFVEALDINGMPFTKPRLLDAFGELLPDGANPVFFDGVGGNPQPFEFEPETDFSAIFPASLPFPITN